MIGEPKLKIAVISDLHCQKADNSSKVTRLHTKLLDKPTNQNPVESFKKLIEEYNKKVDYFFVLGDITDKADLEGFILGTKLVKEIHLTLNADKLFFAVGNHDMYRKKESEKERQSSEFMMKQTNGFPFLFKDNKSVPALEKEFWSEKNCIIEDDKSIIFILNTSCYMDSQNINSLDIDDTLFEEIKIKISKYKNNNKIKLAICHHHPIPQSDFDGKYTSLDCINHGDKLINLLNEANFTLYMHGHKHFAKFQDIDNFPIFCSGSFSSLENTANFHEHNTAHFINIYKNDDDNKYKGIIETWIYNTDNGWIQSLDKNTRFPANTGFGTNTDIKLLSSNIYDHFYKVNDQNKLDKRYIPIKFEDVIKIFPDLYFLNPKQQKELEENLIKFDVNTDIINKKFQKNYI